MKSSIINLPTPSNINYMWNMGSLLGICLMIQIISGMFLSMHYSADVTSAFSYISHIMRDINYGWLLRNTHANGASMFFIFIYLHISRGLFYQSYHLKKTWFSGITLLLMLMMTAFMGYILPWGQMSFWGATVITNLLSAVPYIGTNLTHWIWGGFAINNATLQRFFSLHFIMPLIMSMMSLMHIMLLHSTGSNNPLGLPMNTDKMPFHPYFTWKDILGLSIVLTLFLSIVLTHPLIFSDPENFNQANPMITPIHIQPEWYFLFAYAILRSIPNKLGGVLGLLMSILILVTLPLSIKNKLQPNLYYNKTNKLMFWILACSFLMLSYLGACPIEYPFMQMSQLFSITYFSYFILLPIIYLLLS
uniref:cytochrome b n=1 Tax=Tinaminyssus melloi TaxID=105222 RepID=UPI001BC864A7|nr:cytochrome b [Tinaminyssus melloi]QGA47516.2 cytochrome b [Tinaminyssus melloi]